MKVHWSISILKQWCLALFLIGIMSGVAPGQTVTVTRTLPDRYVPGQQVDVTLEIVVQGNPRLVLDIVEYFPYGWHFVSSNIEPNEIEDGDCLAWEFAPVSDHYTIQYKLLVPSNETGARGFLCEALLVYTFDLDCYFTVGGGDNLILGPEGGDIVATRDTPDSYKAGQLFTVGITLESNYAPQSVVVEETFDASIFTVGAISPPGIGEYLGEENGRGKIRWTINFYQPPMNLIYALTPQSLGTGPSQFEGKWELTTGDTGVIVGDQQIIPYREDQPQPDPLEGCFRTFVANPKVYLPGKILQIKLDFMTQEPVYGLTVSDRIPADWTFSNTGGGVVTGQTITWTPEPGQPQNSQSYEYSVLVPEGAVGQKIFIGAYAFRPRRLDSTVYYYLVSGDDVIGDAITDVRPAPVPITRELPDGYIFDGLIDVTLSYDILEASPPISLTINESIPKDWQLVASNPPVESTTSRSLRWSIQGKPVVDGVITYTLQVKAGDYGDKLFTGSYTASSGLEPVAGVIGGESQLDCLSCTCPDFYDEGGVVGLINQYELIEIIKRIKAGEQDPRDLFCFQLFYWTTAQPAPTPTPPPQ